MPKLVAMYDTNNKACGIDLPNYPYMYYPYVTTANLTLFLNARVCVAACPQTDGSNG